MFEDPPGTDPAGPTRKTTNAPPHCFLHLKVVPGSRKDSIVGALGQRLKVKVAAPPEEGKANAAACGLIAARLGLKPRDVTVVVGHASAEKTLRIEGLTAAEAEGRLG